MPLSLKVHAAHTVLEIYCTANVHCAREYFPRLQLKWNRDIDLKHCLEVDRNIPNTQHMILTTNVFKQASVLQKKWVHWSLRVPWRLCSGSGCPVCHFLCYKKIVSSHFFHQKTSDWYSTKAIYSTSD